MKTPPIRSVLLDSLSILRAQLHAAVLLPIVDVDAEARHQNIDPDYKGSLHGDPAMTMNPASHYAEDSPGYITSNGRGSLEVGAAKD